MIRIDKRLPRGRRLAKVLLQKAYRLELAFEERRHPPDRAFLSDGREVALALPEGPILRGGDVLVAEDGSLVCVEAAKEPVLRVRAHDAQALARAAYRLGQAHVSTDIRAEDLRVHRDDRLAQELAAWGLVVEEAQLPFEPDLGAAPHEHEACAHHEHRDGHSHAHDHCDHEHRGHHHHGHGHGHGHAHDHPHDDDHEHGPGCEHGAHSHEQDESSGRH